MNSTSKLAPLFVLLLAGLLTYAAACGKAEAPDQGVLRVGSWVEYTLESGVGEQALKGSLKISVLERKKIEEDVYYWIERKETLGSRTEIYKFLAMENPGFDLRTDFEPWQKVREVVFQKGSARPKRVPEVQVKKHAPKFIESAKTRRFGNSEDLHPAKISELAGRKVTLDGKQVQAAGIEVRRSYVSRVNLGFIHMEDTTEALYRVWTHPDAPLGGLIALEHESSTVSENKLKPEASSPEAHVHALKLSLKASGDQGAASEITGEPETLQAPAFPFLKGKPSSGSGK